MSQSGENKLKLVTVVSTSDKAEIAVFESLLEEAGIPYLMANKEMAGIFGWGNSFGGQVEIKVREEDAEEVHALLEAVQIEENDEQPPEE